MTWIKVDKEAAQHARNTGQRVRFTADGWLVEKGDDDDTEHRGHDPTDVPATEAADLTVEAAAVFGDMVYRPMEEEVSELDELRQRVGPGGPTPLQRTKEGTYVTVASECECGEQYMVWNEHERTSARHKQWRRGGIEVPVPPQPLYSAYPKGIKTPPLEMGVNKICERCGARDKKGLDYYPDKDSRADRRFPCRRCNGHGIRPNVGPA